MRADFTLQIVAGRKTPVSDFFPPEIPGVKAARFKTLRVRVACIDEMPHMSEIPVKVDDAVKRMVLAGCAVALRMKKGELFSLPLHNLPFEYAMDFGAEDFFEIETFGVSEGLAEIDKFYLVIEAEMENIS